MSNYSKLVKSRFFGNIKAEFKMAQTVMKLDIPFDIDDVGMKCDQHYNKSLYEFYLYDMNCIQDLQLALEDPDLVNYVQCDHIILLFSKKKKLVDDSLMYTHYINGDIPFYRGKHKIDRQYIHTAMIDTRFIIPPCTTN